MSNKYFGKYILAASCAVLLAMGSACTPISSPDVKSQEIEIKEVRTSPASNPSTNDARESEKDIAISENPPFLFEHSSAHLRLISCPDPTAFQAFDAIKIKAVPVELGEARTVDKALPKGVTFWGGWHLTNENKRFGGLSGLEISEKGDLLAISDQGDFIEIGLTNGQPNGIGALASMKLGESKMKSWKGLEDSEGLAYQDGLAFVSFERDHRILAFDLGNCGAAANMAPLAKLPKEILGIAVERNNGPEALTLYPDGSLFTGYETVIKGRSYLFEVSATGTLTGKSKAIKTPLLYKLVGASKSATLLRAYDPILGNRNRINLEGLKKPIKLGANLNVDNFEGIAEVDLKDGSKLLYIVSDNNFSDTQRTLLYAFKISPTLVK